MMTTPTVPFYPRHLCIEQDELQDLAAQRAVPPGLQQRRDSQGQFVSHKDVPERAGQEQ